MTFSIRRLLMLGASGLVLAALPTATMAQPAAEPAPAWAQAASDLPADPAVRYGVLPNGMRYAIMRNATPPGQASLRLRIDAGSLNEAEDQRGLAHFTEHMLFNGTEEIPETELLRILERLGLAFGADTNAATDFDQTYYQLELPRTDEETVGSALRILRQQVSAALMDPAAIDAERNVIVGEERSRNTPQLRALIAQLSLLAEGQRLADRIPIGDLEVIRSAPAERFVAFYDAYYRPSRTTLVAVGDFELDEMESRIAQAFSDWTPRAADGPEPDLGTVRQREPETAIQVEPGVQSLVQINWTRPPDLDPDTMGERRDDLVQALGLAVLSRRLGEMSRADDPPFLFGAAVSSTLYDSLDLTTLLAAFNPGGHARAIEALEQEQRRLAQFGVTEAELEREITEVRTGLENAVSTTATRVTPALAAGLLSAVNGDVVFTAPQTNLDLFNAAVANLTVEEVNASVAAAFTGQGPLVLVSSPAPIEGGEAAVTAVLEASRQTPVTAAAAAAALEWPYADFGAPGTVTERREIAEVGATVVTFANGSTLTVKPTDFRDDEVLVSVRTGLGSLGLPTDRTTPQSLAPLVFAAGGLGKLSADQLARVLNGRIYGVNLTTADDAYVLNGATRPQDLALQLQVLAAYLTDPGVRPAPFEQIKGFFPQIVAQQRATPQGAFALASPELLASGDQRDALPSADTVAGWTNDQMREQIVTALGQGPVHVTLVGDITVGDAVAATAATFGALPTRPPLPTPDATSATRSFPAGVAEPVRLTHTGAPEQALGFIAWPGPDAVGDHTEARAINVLSRIIELRALEEIRERQALAYSPGVDFMASQTFPDYGRVSLTALTTPETLPAFFAAAEAIAADLAANPVSQDELDRARRPLIESQRQAQAGNGWWLGELSDIVETPGDVEQITTSISDIEALTPADIQAAARRWLRPDAAWKATVTAETAAP